MLKVTQSCAKMSNTATMRLYLAQSNSQNLQLSCTQL